MCCWLATAVTMALAAPHPQKLWSHWEVNDPLSTRTIDHSSWNAFLSEHVRPNRNGINTVEYDKIDAADHQRLNDYIWRLSQVDLPQYNRREQLAYWINLYNAIVVKTILEHYPTRSINDINISPGYFSEGPWTANLVRVGRYKVSLEDIESRILRPIWNDVRIHYALNYAAIGSPNLQAQAFTAQNLEELLNKAAFEFINSGRAVSVIQDKLITSAIYDWFIEDFGGDVEDLLTHLRFYAKPKLLAELRHAHHIDKTVFNWHINATSKAIV